MAVERSYGPLTVRFGDPADAEELAPKLRAWDLVEIMACGFDPLTALTRPFWFENGPWTRAFILEGRCIGMGGVTPLPDGSGHVWFLGSDEVDRPDVVLATAAAARHMVGLALAEFDPLHNVIPRRHQRAIRWLEHLGFDIDPEIVHLHGIAFLRFSKTR